MQPFLKVTFSDSSSKTFHEEQSFMAIVKTNNDDGINSNSHSKIFSLWNHHHDGLAPSFIDLLVNSEYFYDIENPSTIYSTSSVVKLERID